MNGAPGAQMNVPQEADNGFSQAYISQNAKQLSILTEVCWRMA